jgi:hypothetical protein
MKRSTAEDIFSEIWKIGESVKKQKAKKFLRLYPVTGTAGLDGSLIFIQEHKNVFSSL